MVQEKIKKKKREAGRRSNKMRNENQVINSPIANQYFSFLFMKKSRQTGCYLRWNRLGEKRQMDLGRWTNGIQRLPAQLKTQQLDSNTRVSQLTNIRIDQLNRYYTRILLTSRCFSTYHAPRPISFFFLLFVVKITDDEGIVRETNKKSRSEKKGKLEGKEFETRKVIVPPFFFFSSSYYYYDFCFRIGKSAGSG